MVIILVVTVDIMEEQAVIHLEMVDDTNFSY
jgi:hypothetical protein